MRDFKKLLILTTFSCFMHTAALAADWGSLKGQFVFDGAAPESKALNVNKDVEFCSKHELVDETLVVGEEGGLSNVFVYLYLKRGKKVDIHPDMAEPSSDPVIVDNKGCRFEPHVTFVRTGQPLEITNSDEGIGHNTNAKLQKNPGFNELVAYGSSIKKVFTKGESYPATIACNVHPWMKAYLLVSENPYAAMSDSKGNFEIKNLPAGEHEFIFWHEGKGNIRNLEVGGTKTSRRGRAKLTIPAGDTLDIGQVKISASTLGL